MIPATPQSPGDDVSEAIPLSVPHLAGNEWRYVKECLDSSWISSVGPAVTQFESEFAALVGCRHAVAVVNGTAALHLGLLAAGVEPGDEVAVSSLSFISPANAIRYAGAWPVFIDAEPGSWQLDPARLEEFLEQQCERTDLGLVNRRTGRRVRAVLPVHILGHPVDMRRVCEIASRYALAVVEDAAEALGTRCHGKPAGTFGDAGCFSFNGNKVVTAGGGGIVACDDDRIAERVRYLSTQAKDPGIEYVHRERGFNYRLTSLQAALGRAQLEQLDTFVAAKRANATFYARAFANTAGLTWLGEAPWAHSAYWLCSILVDAKQFGATSREVIAALATRRIEARPLWEPLNRSAAFRDCEQRACPVAEGLYENVISIPSSVGLNADQRQRVVDAIDACPRTAV